MENDNKEPRLAVWEKHFQSIMVTIITGAVLFTANFIYGQNKDQALLAAQVSALSTQISKLEGKLDAMSANYVSRAEFADHESRIRLLEYKKGR
jgi:outer membrane murein-binding lipoprotein Lpp